MSAGTIDPGFRRCDEREIEKETALVKKRGKADQGERGFWAEWGVETGGGPGSKISQNVHRERRSRATVPTFTLSSNTFGQVPLR